MEHSYSIFGPSYECKVVCATDSTPRRYTLVVTGDLTIDADFFPNLHREMDRRELGMRHPKIQRAKLKSEQLTRLKELEVQREKNEACHKKKLAEIEARRATNREVNRMIAKAIDKNLPPIDFAYSADATASVLRDELSNGKNVDEILSYSTMLLAKPVDPNADLKASFQPAMIYLQ